MHPKSIIAEKESKVKQDEVKPVWLTVSIGMRL